MIFRNLVLSLTIFLAPPAPAQVTCHVDNPTATMSIPYVREEPELSTDPQSEAWRNAGAVWIEKDCTQTLEYPDLRSEARAFWTRGHVFFLFICPFRELNLFLQARGNGDRDKLWDRDVVEIFLGDDWQNIRHYREFEIAPTGDWIDLAIDLDRKGEGARWNSGWRTLARIDQEARIWYAAAAIPLRAVSRDGAEPGTRWRMNLYRIDGKGPDAVRRFLCWQPTCAVNRDPNHVPEAFGTLVFGK